LSTKDVAKRRLARWPLLLAALAVLGPPVSADAAFPGRNGKLAFVSARDGNWELYVMNADGSSETRLTSTSANEGHPSWSADGRNITFNRDRPTGPCVRLADPSAHGS
jgi:Tol biopolymer transport system component